ncbi:hypothetical protein LXL04_038698 [Taraxacum kok-saghyz]
MGLYGQRVRCLSLVCEDEKQAVAVKSQLQQIARPMYSNPPVHGALVVSTVLGNPDLKQLWLKEVKAMADRIIGMRSSLRENIEKLGSPLSWEHITNQIGMFCYSGMTPEQVDRLTNEYHFYMTRNGRISMAEVTTGNVEAVQMRTIIGGGNGGTNLGHLFQFAADQFSDAGALLSAQHIFVPPFSNLIIGSNKKSLVCRKDKKEL